MRIRVALRKTGRRLLAVQARRELRAQQLALAVCQTRRPADGKHGSSLMLTSATVTGSDEQSWSET